MLGCSIMILLCKDQTQLSIHECFFEESQRTWVCSQRIFQSIDMNTKAAQDSISLTLYNSCYLHSQEYTSHSIKQDKVLTDTFSLKNAVYFLTYFIHMPRESNY